MNNASQHSLMATALVAKLIGRLGRLIPVTSDNSIVIFQYHDRRHPDAVDYLMCWDTEVYTRASGTNPSGGGMLEFTLESPSSLADFVTAALIRKDRKRLVLDGRSELVVGPIEFFTTESKRP